MAEDLATSSDTTCMGKVKVIVVDGIIGSMKPSLMGYSLQCIQHSTIGFAGTSIAVDPPTAKV